MPINKKEITKEQILKAMKCKTAEELMALCERRLADFKRPRDIRFVANLPRSMGGVKVRKADLRALLKGEGEP